MTWFPASLRTLRLHLPLLALAATLPTFLLVLLLASRERSGALRHAETEARLVAGIATREHAHQVLGAQRLLLQLGRGEVHEDIRPLLPGLLKANPALANLGLLDAEGRLVYSVVPPEGRVDMKDEPAFQGARAQPGVAVGRYRIGEIVHRPILILATSLAGKPSEVLYAALDLAWLENLGPQAQLPTGTALFIADRAGGVLARGGEAAGGPAVGQRLPAWERMAGRWQGMTEAVMPDGRKRLFVAASLPEVPDLFVAVGLPEAAVLREANLAFQRTLVVLALLLLLTVLGSLVAADISVLRDLRLLAGATRRFGAGDLQARAPQPTTRGEIQDLAAAFNAMAETLAHKHDEAQEAQAQLRALSRRLQAAREEEGARISRELHDQLGQDLTALKLAVGALRLKAQAPEAGPQARDLSRWCDEAGAQIDAAIDSVRRIAGELRPSVLDRLGLLPALEWLAGEFQRRSGVACRVRAEGLEGALSPEQATAFFRITQEALTNVARHAGAEAVEITLTVDEAQAELCIRDDGRGFGEAGPGGHLGILGMEERIGLLGGRLQLGRAPQGGAELCAILPRGILPGEDGGHVAHPAGG
jgi:signal transduction histidine kinase